MQTTMLSFLQVNDRWHFIFEENAWFSGAILCKWFPSSQYLPLRCIVQVKFGEFVLMRSQEASSCSKQGPWLADKWFLTLWLVQTFLQTGELSAGLSGESPKHMTGTGMEGVRTSRLHPSVAWQSIVTVHSLYCTPDLMTINSCCSPALCLVR